MYMLNIKKYKRFINLKNFLYILPKARILKFKRTKWKNLQKKITPYVVVKKTAFRVSKKRRPILPFLDNLYFTSCTKESRFKKFYKNSLVLKRSLSLFFFGKLLTIDFKKLINQKSKDVQKLWLKILIKPFYLLEVLLCKLGFYTTIFHLRQDLLKKKILVNNQAVGLNFILKKGDLISMPVDISYTSSSFPNFLCSMLEVDYYSNSVIILSDLMDLNLESLPIFYSERLDLNQFIDYITNK